MDPFKIFKGIGSKVLSAPETTAVHGLVPDTVPIRPQATPSVPPHGNSVVHGMWGEGKAPVVPAMHEPALPPTTTPKEWTHVTPEGVNTTRGNGTVPPAPTPPGPKEWTHVTPQSAIDQRNMHSKPFERVKPVETPATPAAPAAAAKKKMGWKTKAGVVGGIGAAGWIGNDMAHSFNAPSPNPEQYQTAGDNELLDRLHKTAEGIDTKITNHHKEASEMGIMERLEKTASVVEAIHSIAQATGHSPEEIAQLADEDPEQFMQLHQEINGGQGEDLTLDPNDPQNQVAGQAETQGMPQAETQVPQQAAPQEAAPQGNPANSPQGGLLQNMGAPQGDPQAVQQEEAPQGGLLQSMAPQGDPQQAVPQGGVAQAVTQGAPQADPQAAQAQMGTPVGGAVDHSGLLQAISQAASQGAQEGAQQAINQMGGGDASANPRSGAASVSHNPAGVDKTAADADALILRLEQTADALNDVSNAIRMKNAPVHQTEEEKTASLMESLEKTAKEGKEEKSKANATAIVGGVVGAAGGAKVTHDWEKSQANSDHEWAIKDKKFQDTKASMFQHTPPGKSMEELNAAHLGNLKKIPGKTLKAGLGGAAVGAGIGYAAGKLTDEYNDRKNDRKLMLNHVLGTDSKTASESLMDSLEKTAEKSQSRGEAAGKGALMGAGVGTGLSGATLGIGMLTAKKLGKVSPEAAESLSKALLSPGRIAKAVGKDAVVGGAIGAGIGAAKYKKSDTDNEEQSASEDLMESLEKTALGLGAIGKGIGSFVKNISGKGVREAEGNLSLAHEQHKLWNEPIAFSHNAQNVGVSNARNHLDTLETNHNNAIADLGKARENQTKAFGQAAIGGGGLLAGGMLSNHKQNTAAEEPVEIEKVASENEVFMNGIFKEAAAQIIQMEMPKAKVYVDPMHKIKF
jgi:hypothetical protein